ncbi:hypothetical protein U9M48_013434 [Paspalum notatum var. saurae]|uniref:Uncharacterized protein n=1 Tax=Paspalum notatum var. saurae TaxID=547442 RepID=A0AAQ3WJQ2_PASNO
MRVQGAADTAAPTRCRGGVAPTAQRWRSALLSQRVATTLRRPPSSLPQVTLACPGLLFYATVVLAPSSSDAPLHVHSSSTWSLASPCSSPSRHPCFWLLPQQKARAKRGGTY